MDPMMLYPQMLKTFNTGYVSYRSYRLLPKTILVPSRIFFMQKSYDICAYPDSVHNLRFLVGKKLDLILRSGTLKRINVIRLIYFWRHSNHLTEIQP